ncbi:hypothetical protein Ddye_024173 [Dipteronia dyeriana]|uniref:PWI domain-containing protein n=1 Tax=Dipteronia dyeriana TaxID=168575 RepID=A0AAD9TUA8_9ROSI|nr:hypothetical protein Ddye_024173 [Dipteronia dyeriana]
MSGGFFRGTSADQDTRFSNKQAKLMKSQKFAPELDSLVDMTKVKMDVVKPWIATRVTELLGFEDEVLINFIYGLLDGKVVNGKEIQISLTGFMEKNTGKFMKELWILLLSAQKNASGVPQQFLDAKEEETRKKKVEADQIANEIQKKKERESREFVQERSKKRDGAADLKASEAALDSNSKTILAKASSFHPEDEKEAGEQNGVRGRNRFSNSPRSAARSPSPHRGSQSHSYSSSSEHKSRSLSRSPVARRRSSSSDRMHYSPRRRSITPRKRHSPWISRSPSRRRSSYFRRRSRSRSVRRSPFRRRSPSPVRRRRSPSPVRRRRSPSPIRRRRSPSPIRRRRSPSPIQRRRSPSPIRRRRSPSPIRRRRSPSPVRHLRSPPVRRRVSPSPIRRRGSPLPIRRGSPSPVRHGSLSPMKRRSLSPMQHSSPSPMRHRSPSPMRRGSLSPKRRISHSPVRRQLRRSPPSPQDSSPSPVRHRSPLPARMRSPIPRKGRSPSPGASSSPSPIQHRASSPVRNKSASDSRRSPVHSPKEKNRIHEKLSPVAHRSSSSMRSPRKVSKDQKDIRNKVSTFSPSPERSPTVSKSPPPHATRKRSTSADRRSFSPNESPVRHTRDRVHHDDISSPLKTRERRPHQGGPVTRKEHKETDRTREDVDHKSVSLPIRSVHSSTASKRKDSLAKVHNEKEYSPERSVGGHRATESRSCHDSMDSRKDKGLRSERLSQRGDHPGTSDHQTSPTLYKDSLPGDRKLSSHPGESQKSEERNHSRSTNGKDSNRQRKSENVTMAVERVDHNNRNDTLDSSSGESDRHKTQNKDKRKHKKHGREEVASDDDYSSDSEIERKEAKRRRKEEKKLRKEEKRRRRDERRRRRGERRAEKLKLRNQSDPDASDGEHVSRRDCHLSDNEETESEQKKLEIELRNKALESIKAKKNNNH